VNINLRPYYAEGSKTMGFEIAEQLGWRTPQHIVVPMAGGALIGKIHKAFTELATLGFIKPSPLPQGEGEGVRVACKIYGAQPTGCNPITGGLKSGSDTHKPVRKPNTIAKSLAIGDPADGFFAIKVMRETGGWGEDVSDAEIAEAMIQLARTEGIFAETAGGVTLAVTKKLIEQGRIPRDEEIVICITGNGLKTQDAVTDYLPKPAVIKPSLEEFERLMEEAKEPVLV
jgi:threonine synthase